MGELSKILNIGSVLEEQLLEMSISNFKELKKIGSKTPGYLLELWTHQLAIIIYVD